MAAKPERSEFDVNIRIKTSSPTTRKAVRDFINGKVSKAAIGGVLETGVTVDYFKVATAADVND